MFDHEVALVTTFLERVIQLNARYRAGQLQAYVPEGLSDSERRLDELIEELLPASHAAFKEASRSLFYSLPVAFDPAESVGPYLAAVDRDASGRPYRFLDMGAQIATSAFGENDPLVVGAILESLPFVTSRYAHSEYQTTLSLRLKAELNRIAPAGTPRHFVVNTGAEAVENAIKSVLLNRVKNVTRGGRWLHRIVRRSLPWPDTRQSCGDPTDEGATRVSHVRLAAHRVPIRGRRRTQGHRSARGTQSETAVGSAGVGTDAASREAP